MRFLLLLDCSLAAAALRPSPAFMRTPLGNIMRSSKLVAQQQQLPVGWTTAFDQESGATYYYNEQSGHSQWDPPHQADAPVLPAGWTTGYDQSCGATYYYNEQTGQSQWEPPQSSSTQQQDSDAQVVWRMALTSGWGPKFAGKYTLRAGEEEALGRYDMFLHKPTRPWVSRKQCLVQIAPDGSATLESNGKAPTLWCEPGGPWNVLIQGEKVLLADGDKVSLDYNDPDGTVFMCQQEMALGK